MSKVERVNELLHREIANFINKNLELNDVLLTVSYIISSPDFKLAKVGVSVLPENRAGKVLEKLRSMSSSLAKEIAKKTKLRRVPRFVWEFDETEKEAAKLDELFKHLDDEDL